MVGPALVCVNTSPGGQEGFPEEVTFSQAPERGRNKQERLRGRVCQEGRTSIKVPRWG